MSRPLPDPVLFLDHSLGAGAVAAALRKAGARVEVLVDYFPSDTSDEKWLVEVGARGWIVLTKDQRIRRRHVEMRALEEARVTAFVLTAGDLTGDEMASAFVSALGRIRKSVRDYEPPFVAGVDARGQVKLLTATVRRASKRK